MVNYQLGKIYKIVCNITDECYIGSTCQPALAQRLTKHVAQYKYFLKGKCGKYMSFDILQRNDYKMLLIQSFPCNSKDELTAQEGVVIRQYKLNSACINKKIEGRTRDEWVIENKDKIKEDKKKFYEDNKEDIKKYYEYNKDKIKEDRKTYYENNKDKIKEDLKKYYEKNKEKMLEYQRQHTMNNNEKSKEYKKKYYYKTQEKYKEKITCECGACYRKSNKKQHDISKKHQDFSKRFS